MQLQHPNIIDDRHKELTEFSNWILDIGNGTIKGIKDEENDDATWIEIPTKYIVN